MKKHLTTKRGLILFAAMTAMMLCLTGCGLIGRSSKPYEAAITNTVRLRTESTGGKSDSIIIIDLDVKNKSKEYLDPDVIAYQASATLDGTPLTYEYLSTYCPVYVSTAPIAPKEHGTVQLAFRLGSANATGELSLLLTNKAKKTTKILETSIPVDDVDYHIIPTSYGLTIDRVFTTDDGEGTSLLVLDMTFANNSENSAAPSTARFQVFQNGIELDTAYLPYKHPENDDTLEGNVYTEIQPGKTIAYRKVFELKDDSEVELYATELNYTGYEIEPILEAKIAVAEGAETSDGTIVAEILENNSAFDIEITDYLMGADKYSDIPVVVFLADFTNNSDEAVQFSYDCDVTLSQGGVSLEKNYISGVSSYNSAEVAPGATNTVILAYELKDPENNIDVVITDSSNYANPVILEQSYTLEEILEATIAAFGDDDEVLDEDSLPL